VVRTRVGYCGGTTPAPTYHRLGDHSETVEVDYDPRVLSYADLLDVFFASHSPAYPAMSVQYRSAVFYRTDDERAAAEAAIARAEAARGSIHTAVEPYHAFHLAEGYHQKHSLRGHADLMREFSRLFPGERGFVDSTAAARVNGWLSGCATTGQLERELGLTGLTPSAQETLRAVAMPGGRARIGCSA
jgi:methionine-S-sulfoxide reductase